MGKEEKTIKASEIFKTLSDPTRLKILQLLMRTKEMCVHEIAEGAGASNSATSHQLAKLEDRGIVKSFRMGQTICYELQDNETVRTIKKAITLFTKP